MIIEFKDNKYRLPQIAQYQAIPYGEGLCCSECQNTIAGYRWSHEMHTDKVVGYCVETDGTYQIIKECKHCHEKYRFHLARRWYEENGKILFDVEDWKHNIGLHLFMYHQDHLKI